MARQDELDAAVEAWTSERGPREAEALLQSAGVAAGAVLDVAQASEDPQLLHRESLAPVEHPEMGPVRHTRTAWRSRRGNHGVSGPAPLFGDGIDRALRELLELDEAEVTRLIEERVVARSPLPRAR
jgi:crotonobetainyl-CoA:carnitine CoA-transferase CaiB-like acyl-CoA transferase